MNPITRTVDAVKRAFTPTPAPVSDLDYAPPPHAITSRKGIRTWDTFNREESRAREAELAAEMAKLSSGNPRHLVGHLAANASGTLFVMEAPRYQTRADVAPGAAFDDAGFLALPLAEGLALYLSPQSPSKILEARKLSRLESRRTAREEQKKATAIEEDRRAQAEAEAARLTAWRARPRMERALLQLAAAHPDEPVYRQLLDALAAEPVVPNHVPAGF